MRLIDADGLEATISQNGEDRDEIIHDIMEKYGLLYENNVDEDKIADFAKDILKAVCNVIESEPTAYNVDEVIKNLDNMSVYYDYEIGGERVGLDLIKQAEAAEIVKNGGVLNETD